MKQTKTYVFKHMKLLNTKAMGLSRKKRERECVYMRVRGEREKFKWKLTLFGKNERKE